MQLRRSIPTSSVPKRHNIYIIINGVLLLIIGNNNLLNLWVSRMWTTSMGKYTPYKDYNIWTFNSDQYLSSIKKNIYAYGRLDVAKRLSKI